MKKKLFTLLMAIIATASLHAQEGTIVYTDYGSDTVVGFNHHTITFDVDFDGEDDFYIQNYMGGPDDHLEYIRFCALILISQTWHILWDKKQDWGMIPFKLETHLLNAMNGSIILIFVGHVMFVRSHMIHFGMVFRVMWELEKKSKTVTIMDG